MCGICGIYRFADGPPVTEAQVRRMCQELVHRGPDEEGVYAKGTVGLGIRRLRVIDLETGSQPVCNEDGSIWVVFNGEIYNYRELRGELEAQSHRFATHSDTEVIVHAYEQHGPDFVHRLNGMFAIALWDGSRKTLWLYRDRMGVKPLFYTANSDRLAFGSEIKAILALDDMPRRMNLQGLCDYLAFQYVAPPDTIFENICKLPPGHRLRMRGNALTVEPYWQVPEPDPKPMTEGECIERIRELLSDAVRLRLVSDVPLGVFLSGGIDSSILTALMAEHMDRPVKTFSMGFSESSYNELPYAQKVAERYGTEHHAFVVKPPDLTSLLPDLVWYYDEPFGDSSAIPTYMLSRLTRQHVTVALSGEGGDELFGGYPRYMGIALEPIYGWVPPSFWKGVLQFTTLFTREGTGYANRAHRFRRFLQAAQKPSSERYLSLISIFSLDARQRLLGESVNGFNRASDSKFLKVYGGLENASGLGRALYADLKTYLPDDILVKGDRASMAHALEVRTPFLDYRLVELASRIPDHLKIRGLTTKYILKRAFHDRIPTVLLNRPKHGFGVPVGTWFRGSLRDYLQDHLLSTTFAQRGYFRMPEVERYVKEHLEGRRNWEHQLWLLLNFDLWHRRFLGR